MNATYTFQGKTYDPAILIGMTGPELINLYNDLFIAMSSSHRLNRFSDKSTAATRCLKALREYEGYCAVTTNLPAAKDSQLPSSSPTEEAIEPLMIEEPEVEVEAEPEFVPAASSWLRMKAIPSEKTRVEFTRETEVMAGAAPKNRKRGTDTKPNGMTLAACKLGSKQAVLRDTLMTEGGVTMAELIAALSFGKPWVEATVRSGFGWDMKRKGYGVKSNFDAEGVERFELVIPADQVAPEHYVKLVS